MDFPNISKQRGASSHPYSTRGGYPAPSSQHHYAPEPLSAMPDGLWSATNSNGGNHYHSQHHNDPYRSAPSAPSLPAREQHGHHVAPYRHQNRSRRPAAVVPEEPTNTGQQQRAPSYGHDIMKPPASRTLGGEYGSYGGFSRGAMYPGVTPNAIDDYYDPYSPGAGTNDDGGHYYDPAPHDRYPGKSVYDPEIPSLVGSDHSSFELPSDDDEEHGGWDRKIRPEEKMRIMNGYLSDDDENDRYYSRTVKPRSAPPPPPSDYHEGYYPRTAKPRMTAVQQAQDEYDHGYYSQRPVQQQSRIPPVVAVAGAAPAHTTTPRQQIEVAPGEWLFLRGAAETWAAVQNDFYMPTECVCCQHTIFCIQDAAFVLCPKCKVVSPGFSDEASTGGVGLGFTMEELAKWQVDIERSHKVAAKQRM